VVAAACSAAPSIFCELTTVFVDSAAVGIGTCSVLSVRAGDAVNVDGTGSAEDSEVQNEELVNTVDRRSFDF